jgi:type IX secretion system PorP/SprF family membrane protein
MKTRILLFVLIFTALTTSAQQDAQFTQYMYNTINVNPAYAGSRGVMSVFGLYRTQWVGIDGAPDTGALSLNTPINNSNLGMGISFVKDEIGPTTENNISADVSYTVKTSETYKLSFGLKGSLNLFDLTVEGNLNPVTLNDKALMSFNKTSPNIGAGVYFHSDKSYIGFSIPNFLQNRFKYDDNQSTIHIERINYYLIAGHVFDVTPDVKFKPALLTKLVEGAPLQVDVSGNFLINEKLVLGLAYRWDAAVSALAGFQINPSMYIGYGYDMETTRLKNYNSGSHEIFLRYEFLNNYNKIISPRFF